MLIDYCKSDNCSMQDNSIWMTWGWDMIYITLSYSFKTFLKGLNVSKTVFSGVCSLYSIKISSIRKNPLYKAQVKRIADPSTRSPLSLADRKKNIWGFFTPLHLGQVHSLALSLLQRSRTTHGYNAIYAQKPQKNRKKTEHRRGCDCAAETKQFQPH